MGADSEYNVKVTTNGDPAGAEQVAASLQKIGKSAEEANRATARESKSGASALEELGRKGADARDIFEGLSAVGRGQEGVLFNLAKAWRGLTAAVVSNPFLALVGIVAGVISIFGNLVTKLGETGAALGKAGGKTKELEKEVASLKEASEGAAGKLKEQATAAATEWERLVQFMTEAQRRSDAMRSAELGERIAEIDAREAKVLSSTRPEDRAATKADFNLQRARLRSQFEASALRSSDLQAGVVRQNAETAFQQSSARTYGTEVEVAQARKALVDAEAVGKDAAASGAPPERLAELSREVMRSREKLAIAEAKLAAQAEEEAKIRRDAQNKINAANETVELNQIRRRTQGLNQTAGEVGGRIDRSDAELERGRRIGGDIRGTLEDARFTPAQFDPRFYHDRGMMERDRAALENRNRTNEAGFPAAVEKARAIAEKLGDGRTEVSEAYELTRILDRIVSQMDKNSKSQMEPLIRSLRDFERRLNNLDSRSRANNRGN